MARYKDAQRLHMVTDNALIAGAGEYSDYQAILRDTRSLIRTEESQDPPSKLSAREIFHWLSRVMVNRRNKMDPLYNQMLIAGADNDDTYTCFSYFVDFLVLSISMVLILRKTLSVLVMVNILPLHCYENWLEIQNQPFKKLFNI